ncbi:glycine zipper 2TM domain-containing protein [Arenimonas sp. MALMAid1274]|uniref:glycine zipper 2TM domain-containing protein n=1 Tax=Arenimonas sp. MALMAid1274 TaxID=3411630 RepID=UPI003BA2FCC4
MKRIAVRSLVLALGLTAGAASAQDYYEQGSYGYGDDYAAQDAGYYESEGQGYYAGQDDYYDDTRAYAAQDYGVAGPAYASRGDGYNDAAYDLARVTSVDPIVDPGRPVSRQVCESAPAPVYARQGYAPRRTSGGGAVLGAIVGGALGNTVGSGDGRQAATVLGAVIGGAIGNDIERNGGRGDPRYGDDRYGYRGQPSGYYAAQDVQRCRVVTDYRRDERVLGYRVGYEYAGRHYQTTTDYHPGSEIRVRVMVTPEG